jgi:hypothetical protein
MGLKLDINPERRKSKMATEVTHRGYLGNWNPTENCFPSHLPSIHHGELMGADFTIHPSW